MIARTNSGGTISGRLAEILVSKGRATEVKEEPKTPEVPKKGVKKATKKAPKKGEK